MKHRLIKPASLPITQSLASHGRWVCALKSTALLVLWLGLLAPATAFEPLDEARILPRDLWPKARTGAIIRRLEPLRRTVEVYDSHPDARILVEYSVDSVGNAWAFELKEWLVAFGVEADRILLRPGTVDEYSLGLSVVK